MRFQIKQSIRRILILSSLVCFVFACFNVFSVNAFAAQPTSKKSEQIYTKTSFSLLGSSKYLPDFTYLDYVNPNAPKGGTLKLAVVGSFDNFNRYASRGAAESASGELYDRLFTMSEDDITTYYPLIATSVTYSDSFRWAEVTINPNAKFHDDRPITAQDAEFTFTKLMTEGVPQYRVYYEGTTVKALNLSRLRIELPSADREKLLSFIGNFPILPKHFWQDHNLSEPLSTPPLGSGPYFIRDYKMGQYAVYQRKQNYWAVDLPINKGRYNFDQRRIEYYKDSNIALEAFKAGEYDFIVESKPKNWFSLYQGELFDLGHIIKQAIPVTTAPTTFWLSFNVQKELFKDIRVRKALTLAFDFEWLNHAFYYNNYKRPMSFFENTPYAASGKPSQLEQIWLEPFKAIIPADVFELPYQLPKSDASGFNRQNLLAATELLKEAGWQIQAGKLVHQETQQPFEFELLTYMGSDINYAMPFQQNLARLGISMKITALDFAQYQRRVRERDYDMRQTAYSKINYPSSDLNLYWGSEYLNSSYNSSGLHNKAIDSLIAEMSNHLDNEKQLIALGRALDRILMYEYPMIPMWYPSYTYYAYWNKFGKPAVKPTYSNGLSSWWYDSEKASHLPKNGGQ